MSARLDRTLTELRARKEGALMPYLVAGDPDLPTSRALSSALLAGGADLIEFGLPFSDPTADGPSLQAASKRALAAGLRTEQAFELFSEVRRSSDVPIALLLYYNLVFQYGIDRFFARAAAAGVDAALIADLPLEEVEPVLGAAAERDVAPIFIVSARTADARLEQIARHGRGYIYLVARLGVTGVQDTVASELAATVARVRARTDLPLLAGFGLSRPEHVRAVLASGADGAIVGSAIADRIEQNLSDKGAMVEAVRGLVRSMKEATHPTRDGQRRGG